MLHVAQTPPSRVLRRLRRASVRFDLWSLPFAASGSVTGTHRVPIYLSDGIDPERRAQVGSGSTVIRGY